MTRRPDWTVALWDTVDAWSSEPFQWGVHDCCLFAARCIDAMTDTDYAVSLRDCYDDKESAQAFIAYHGSIQSAIGSFLGDMVDARPRRGDIAIVDTASGDGVGVCVGPTVAVPGDGGIVFYPISACRGAWRI